MTREVLKKHWEVIKAYKNGADIQYKGHTCGQHLITEWFDLRKGEFIYDAEYRVKPEPEYIPFDFSDAEFLVGKAITGKTKENTIAIITLCNNTDVFVGYGKVTYEELFKFYRFLDNSPCGKIKNK